MLETQVLNTCRIRWAVLAYKNSEIDPLRLAATLVSHVLLRIFTFQSRVGHVMPAS